MQFGLNPPLVCRIHDALSFSELIQPYLQLPCLPANVSAQYTDRRFEQL